MFIWWKLGLIRMRTWGIRGWMGCRHRCWDCWEWEKARKKESGDGSCR